MAEAQPHASGARRLGDFIREKRDQILSAWEAAARQLHPARDLSEIALRDHMPQFLDELASFVDGARAGLDVAPSEELPQLHALERLDEGYDLPSVVGEYGALRRCVLEMVQQEESPALRSAEMPRLHQAIDHAISTSVVRFSVARERTLKALDRISTAALLHPDVEAFLGETLRVLLETTAAVDSVSVLLLEGGVLRVRASAGFTHPTSAGIEVGRCFAGRIAALRTPLASRDAANDPRVETDVIDRAGTHALYGLPLVLGEELIGVALMGSRSTYEFSHDDRVLFRTMAARATAIIVQGRLRDELSRQKDFYASLLQAQSDLGEGFVLVRDGHVLHANDAFCRLSGYSRDELLHMPGAPQAILPGRASAAIKPPSPTAREADHFESVLIDKAGRHIEVEVAVQPRGEERLLIVRDIGLRKSAEEAREIESARLQALLQVLPVGVALAEAPSGKLVMGNEALRRIWGHFHSAESVADYGAYHGRFLDGRPVQPEDWPLARAVRGEQVPPVEIRIERDDGTEGVSEHAASPIRDAHGKVVAAVCSVVDITERKRTEQELRRALLFRDEIMAVLSHDLRTPLMVVMTGADILLRGDGLNERQQRSAQRIRSAGERIERMIRDLLDYTRARHGGGLPVSPEPTDLAQLCRQAMDGYKETHADRAPRLTVEGDARGRWDPERLLQVISNLVGNALRHGAGAPVEVTVRGEDGHAVLQVHNRGVPIPPHILPIVFEPFRRGNKDTGEGLGLGLYIVRAIVEAHGGTVAARSSAAEGTTFTARLPRGL